MTSNHPPPSASTSPQLPLITSNTNSNNTNTTLTHITPTTNTHVHEQTRLQVIYEWSVGAWRDWCALVSLSNNFTIRTCCVLLMLKCAFVALTGRGVISILQAILGVIFSIEGFWGAVKYDGATMKRFLIFVVVYFFVSVTIAIINIQTLTAYCSTAADANDEDSCYKTARLYSYLLLGASLGLVPIIFGVGVVFFLAIQSNEASGLATRRKKDSLGYAMVDIVDRMGFSSD